MRLTHKQSGRSGKTVKRNLELCFADKTSQQRDELGRRNLRETGKNITELGPLWNWNRQKVLGLIKEEVGRDHFDQALTQAKEQGRGLILASPHFGAWELAGLKLSVDAAPLNIMYRPNRNSGLDALVLKSRERFGGKCCATTSRGLAQLVKGLKKGEAIALLPDQEPDDNHGVFAPLFGVPAYTMTFINKLALKTGAPIIFAIAERLPKGQGFRMHYLKPDDDIYDEDQVRSATALNKCVEQCIEIAPEQYMWNYKRFKKSPPDTPKRYA